MKKKSQETTKNTPSAESSKLWKIAAKARDNAHSPYSKHKVGSAIRLKSGEIFFGCNIENASYGATVCAERVAIWKAVSELGKIEIAEVVVVTDADKPWPPCGMCRQVISEFATEKTKIHTANLLGIKKSFSFPELLPEVFTSEFLKK